MKNSEELKHVESEKIAELLDISENVAAQTSELLEELQKTGCSLTLNEIEKLLRNPSPESVKSFIVDKKTAGETHEIMGLKISGELLKQYVIIENLNTIKNKLENISAHEFSKAKPHLKTENNTVTVDSQKIENMHTYTVKDKELYTILQDLATAVNAYYTKFPREYDLEINGLVNKGNRFSPKLEPDMRFIVSHENK